jgi:hypothetical protein
LADEDVIWLILDGTVVRVRLDRKATSISLLAVRNMAGDSEAAWRGLLDDVVSRGLPAPKLVSIDGAAGLEKLLGLVGLTRWCSAAPCTSTAICWRTLLNVCMMRSRPTTTT